ncbi:MAG: iron-containing alcohol dehydrogenase, partial [Actinomycetota bacterium]|nr:iron-containing alcohol dehydrogenase [Actinomycetota bacterium]
MHVADSLQPLHIKSLQWDYDVLFAETIHSAAELAVADQHEVLIVCDENVATLHHEALAPLLAAHPTYLVKASEETKSLSGVSALVDWLIQERAVRSATVLAVGGGCIQDLVSFTAHLYYRGINWIFLPTTVLSQSDSCIGAKSGINVLPFKNQLGALHSPRKVVITTEFLSTLPDLEIASGYGEIVKLSVTSSHAFLAQLSSALGDGGIRNAHLLELTRASLLAKQEIIEIDEYETDLRRIL